MSLTESRSLREAEASFLEDMRAQYEGEGYQFVIHPRRSDLPDFLSSYVPDAIATRGDQNIAIEVKARASSSSQQSVQRLSALFRGQPNWRFTVAYMGGSDIDLQRLPLIDRNLIISRAKDIGQLLEEGRFSAAFVMAWSLLEAALNSVYPDEDKRPRLPGTVVQTLAMEGHISEEAERALRALIPLRNRIVHGDLTALPSHHEVRLVIDAVTAVLTDRR